MQTVVGVGDPKEVKKYSAFLAVDVARTSYYSKKFMGVGEQAQTPLQMLPHLERDAGDLISYELVMQLRMKPIQGDAMLRGKEEDLKTYTDQLYIDQLRGGVNTGGKMTRKRTIHDLRAISRVRQSEWWARLIDETINIYISGARGINDDFIEDPDFTGYAGNPIVAPDSAHLIYGGDAISKATLAAEDKMTTKVIDRLRAKSSTLGGGTARIPAIQPCMIDGEPHYVCVMHPWQVYDMRVDTTTGGWLDIQKAIATSEGRKSPLMRGGLGMHNNVILHEHAAVVRFSDYGAGSNVAAARAQFLGRQAGVIAYGSPGTGHRFDWQEETEDRGNQLVITTASIVGVKASEFTIEGTTRKFGMIAVDTAAADPG